MLGAVLHSTDLISTLAISLVAALGFGFLSKRIGLSPIVGYMLAGILVGPHTPGFVANQELATQLAEIGIALLMFGVGLHFSVEELLAVRRIAIPGAIVQSVAATVFGVGIGVWQGWGIVAGLVFGIAISVASTVVLLRGLMERDLLATAHGHVAVGWLVVEDLFTVLILVLLPMLAPGVGAGSGLLSSLGLVALEVLALGLVYVVGVRLVPWFLAQVAKLGSRELFTLAVLAIALGIAYGSAALLGVSMALGAFLGGMVVGRSELSHRAAADALPLRDAFAVLFFVSVGMLFDPGFVVARPGLLLGTVAIVMLVKPLSALAITLALGHPARTGTIVGAGLGQIGEFSFILAGLGVELKVLPGDAYHAILAAALVSIALQPVLFAAAPRLEARLRRDPRLAKWLARFARAGVAAPTPVAPRISGHAIVCGAGRVGSVLCDLLATRGTPLLVVEEGVEASKAQEALGRTVVRGDASDPTILDHVGLERARLLVVTLGDPLATRRIVAHAREIAPELEIVARVHAEAERRFLARHGRIEPVLAELELAIEMARASLERFGVGALEAQRVALELRRGNVAGASGRARVYEHDVGPDSPAHGRRLMDLGLAKGTLVIAIRRGDELLVPDGGTVLTSGDRLFVTGSLEGLAEKLGTPHLPRVS